MLRNYKEEELNEPQYKQACHCYVFIYFAYSVYFLLYNRKNIDVFLWHYPSAPSSLLSPRVIINLNSRRGNCYDYSEQYRVSRATKHVVSL